MLDRFWRDRRRAQAGTTLVELLVSLMIIGLALVIVVGAFSTGLLNATLGKRDVAAQAVVQYELDKINASQYSPAAQPYSECFATETQDKPQVASSAGGACPGYATLRADVTVTQLTTTRQQWTVSVVSLPSGAQAGLRISTYKVNP